jgi:multiple sugar transport system substrate-binding protein
VAQAQPYHCVADTRGRDIMIGRILRHAFILCGLVIAAIPSVIPSANAQPKEISVWTMGGDQPGWQKWLDAIKSNYEKNNPGQSVKITYYDKNALLTALRTSLRAGQGPDVIYTEPDQIEFPDNGYFKPLESVVDWSKFEPWARGAWTRNGHSWGIPYSGYTNEIYYNKKLMKELGVTIPENGRVSQANSSTS